MLTNVGKALTVFVLFMSVSFMSLGLLARSTRIDSKTTRDQFKADTEKLAKEETAISAEVDSLTKRLAEAKVANAADVPALERKAAAINAEIEKKYEEASELTNQVAELAKKVEAKGIEAAARREDIFALRNQLEEIRSHVTRLRQEKQLLSDLLVQAQGILQRAERRSALLESDGARARAYDDGASTGSGLGTGGANGAAGNTNGTN